MPVSADFCFSSKPGTFILTMILFLFVLLPVCNAEPEQVESPSGQITKTAESGDSIADAHTDNSQSENSQTDTQAQQQPVEDLTEKPNEEQNQKSVAETPPPPEEPSFYVGEYQVKGSTLLPTVAVEGVLTPFLGENRTIKDIEAARAALEHYYRDKGYPTVLVSIPEQDVVDGIVYLEVTESKVDELMITGSRYFSLDRIRKHVPALAEGSVPYIPGVQAQLDSLNQATADRQITPVLRPGRIPGTLEVELKVKDEFPVHGGIELNNRYSRDTSETRAIGRIQYDNLWQKEHSLSLQYQTAPEEPDEVKVFSGTYLWRMEDSRNMLVFYGVSSDSEVATADSIIVVGNGNIIGSRFVAPLKSGEHYFHSLSAGIDYKDFGESIAPLGADSLNTPIDYANLAIQYNGTFRNKKSQFGYGVAANYGLKTSKDDVNQFDDKRFNAQPNYFYIRIEADYDRQIIFESHFKAKFNAQIADSPLISNEQFSAGGASSVRGYYESQELGDNAVQATIEWETPHLLSSVKEIDACNLFLFADGANLVIKDPTAGQDEHASIYSAGFGFRYAAWKRFFADIVLAYPLKESEGVEEGKEHWHAKLEYRF